eukprot:6943935-Pyramimonas_sp.AAC.1
MPRGVSAEGEHLPLEVQPSVPRGVLELERGGPCCESTRRRSSTTNMCYLPHARHHSVIVPMDRLSHSGSRTGSEGAARVEEH